jgi:Nucleotidyl transferase AbiEii toxin, Type IV TA system
LKGATLFATWVADPFRPTRDLDLLGAGVSSVERITEAFRASYVVAVDDDGVVFDVGRLQAAPIRNDDAHGGVRVTIDKAKIAIPDMPAEIADVVVGLRAFLLSLVSQANAGRWQRGTWLAPSAR